MRIEISKELTEFPKILIENIKESTLKTLMHFSESYLQEKRQETFEKKGARDGHEKWQALSQFTIAERLLKRGGKYTSKKKAISHIKNIGGIPVQMIEAERKSMHIMRDTGELFGSIQVLDFDEKSIVIGSRLDKARKLHFGDEQNTFGGRKAPIPAREIVFITENDVKEITRYFINHLSEAN